MRGTETTLEQRARRIRLTALVALVIAAILAMGIGAHDALAYKFLPAHSSSVDASASSDAAGTTAKTPGALTSQDSESDAAGSGASASDVTSETGYAAGIADGTYYGDADGFKSTVTVGVTVKDGLITNVEVISQSDDTEYFKRASLLIPRILGEQEAEVDTIAGATYSSKGIEHAVEDALYGDGAPDVARTMLILEVERVIAIVSVALAVAATVWRTLARKRPARMASMRWQRLAIQLMFFMVAPSVFGSLFMGIKLPFDQVWHLESFAVSSFTIQLAVILVFTVVAGRYFCGYACSFGALGDVVYQVVSFVLKKLHLKRPQLPERIEKPLRATKYVVLVGILLAVFLGAMDFISENSPWTAFSRLSNFFTSGLTVLSVVLFVIVVVMMALKERSFCEFLCPLGALFSIIPTLPSGRVRWRRPTCYKGCSACHKNCPVDIDPKNQLLAGECIGCGRCAEVCPAGNIRVGLDARLDAMGLPKVPAYGSDEQLGDAAARKARRAYIWHAIAPLVKALVLLVILWALGVLRFLPALPL